MVDPFAVFTRTGKPRRTAFQQPARLWLLMASALFVFSLLGAYHELRRRETLHDTALGHFTHNLFQTYHELNRFLTSVRDYSLLDPTEAATREDVHLTFDILASRLDLFDAGESGRVLSTDAKAQLFFRDLSAAMSFAEPLLEQLPQDPDAPGYHLVMDALEPLGPQLFELGRTYLLKIESRSDQIMRSVQSGFGYLLAPVLSGGLLFLLFAWQLRHSRRLAAELAAESRQLHMASAELAYRAGHDQLTSLPNRARLLEFLDHGLARAQRAQTSIAVLFVDLDRFKPINDSLGHGAGDEVLRIVAARLRSSVRESDTVARIGGDEFVVLLEGLDEAAQTEVVQRVFDNLHMPIPMAGQTLFVGASIGVSRFPQDGAEPEELVRNADAAMYRAKQSGRDRFVVYTSEINSGAKARLTRDSLLRQALERGEFELHYQPQVRLADGRLTGVEALLRWHQPERGYVPPIEFIPAAEASGLIVAIDDWVLRTACLQAAKWQRDGLMPLRIAVNVSARWFLAPGIVEKVKSVLTEAGLEPQWLEIELTESMLLHDVESAINTMRGLSALGVRIAIDDFGTGYSSLNYLHRFSVNRLKIDRAFVREVHLRHSAGAIARSITALGKSLKVEILAEGIETAEERDFMKAHGCAMGQGYLFGRPVPAEGLVALLRSRAGRSGRPCLPVHAETVTTSLDPTASAA